MAISRQVPDLMSWLPFWKFMEFSFGLSFGMGLGYCAYLNRRTILEFGEFVKTNSSPKWIPYFAQQLVLASTTCLFVFYLWPAIATGILSLFPETGTGITKEILLAIQSLLSDYTAMGLLLVVACTFWHRVSWHVVVTFTFYAAAWDFARDLVQERGFNVSSPHQHYMIIAATLIVGCMVVYLETQSKDPVRPLFLLLTWSCMAIAYLRLLILDVKVLWIDPFVTAETGGVLHYILSMHKGELVVHGIFTLAAIFTTWLACRRAPRPNRKSGTV
jgi:hypothetical protein